MQRPTVLVNMAVTADGKIDTVERRGARISGAADTQRVDRLRAARGRGHGGRSHPGRARIPRLTVRDPALVDERVDQGRPPHSPPRWRWPRGSALPDTAQRAAIAQPLPRRGRYAVIAATTPRRPCRTPASGCVRQGAEVIVHDGDPASTWPRCSPSSGERGIRALMVEGGSTLVAALLDAGLVDELQLAVAPLLFGGETAPTPVGGTGWRRDQAIRLALLAASVDADGDVVLRYAVGRVIG